MKIAFYAGLCLLLTACGSSGGDEKPPQSTSSASQTVSTLSSESTLSSFGSSISSSSTQLSSVSSSANSSSSRFSNSSNAISSNSSRSNAISSNSSTSNSISSLSSSSRSSSSRSSSSSSIQTGQCSQPIQGTANTYNVGGGTNAYPDLHNVPWLSMGPGDVVNIYYRAEPYRTLIALDAMATEEAPFIINGVTDENCNRPIISGSGAIAAADQTNYHNDTEQLGIILIWWGKGLYGNKPSHITIQNLEIVDSASAGIHASIIDTLLVQNCKIHNSNGDGIFVNSKNNVESEVSHNITIRNNQIYDNGIFNDDRRHNLYIQARRAVYEGNYIGKLRDGNLGSALKDRSSGTIIRYNRIIASARAIDLVETENTADIVSSDPLYHDAWVYGNLIENYIEEGKPFSASLIHWGYDNSTNKARLGTLHFYNNTIISVGNQSVRWQFALFEQTSNSIRCDVAANLVDARNNVFWHTGTSRMNMGRDSGYINFSGTNWISTPWYNGQESNGESDCPEAYVEVNVTGTLIEGIDPGLDSSFRPTDNSPVKGQAQGPTATPVEYEFMSPAGIQTRADASDLGALESN